MVMVAQAVEQVTIGWRELTLVSAAISLLPCLYIWSCMPESPRWLHAAGRTAAAEGTLREAIARNRNAADSARAGGVRAGAGGGAPATAEDAAEGGVEAPLCLAKAEGAAECAAGEGEGAGAAEGAGGGRGAGGLAEVTGYRGGGGGGGGGGAGGAGGGGGGGGGGVKVSSAYREMLSSRATWAMALLWFSAGPARYCHCSPRHRMPFNSIHEGSQCVSMRWRAIAARPCFSASLVGTSKHCPPHYRHPFRTLIC